MLIYIPESISISGENNLGILLGNDFSGTIACYNYDRYTLESNNPYFYIDPSGHLVIGYQLASEGAFGPGMGYATGNIWEFNNDGSYNKYSFNTDSFGGGWGGSVSGEGIFGLKITAKDFNGPAYTAQAGFTEPLGVGFGFTWSANYGVDNKGLPQPSKSYATAGMGGVVGPGGAQVYAGQTNTKITLIKSGKWNPIASSTKSSNANQASNNGNSQKTNSKSTNSDSGNSANSSIFNKVITFFKSIFGGNKK